MVQQAAHHLLDLRGKHLRPLCVALASRFGEGFTPRARGLAVAVELVHSATLLHDDVVDLAERRRGEPAACVVYGNAASIFAGDWLLVAALRRIAGAGVDGLLDRMLLVIDEMIVAESVQLERRRKVTGAREDYFQIIEGKTAALFRWAMVAGARVAGLGAEAELALERFGLHLGVAFQAVDDELDFADHGGTGKDALADLREGKVTFPMVVALERDPALRGRLEAMIAQEASRARRARRGGRRDPRDRRARRDPAARRGSRAARDRDARGAARRRGARCARDRGARLAGAAVMTDGDRFPASAPREPSLAGGNPHGVTAEADAKLGSGQMFDAIAARYDFVNRVLSLGLDQGWRRRTVRERQRGEQPRVLAVATGPGELAIAIAKARPGATVIGLDPSAKMLAIAASKIARRGLRDRVTLDQGDAQALPYANCSVDAATIAFGIRNVPDRGLGLRELARVVRPGGRDRGARARRAALRLARRCGALSHAQRRAAARRAAERRARVSLPADERRRVSAGRRVRAADARLGARRRRGDPADVRRVHAVRGDARRARQRA